MYSIEEFDEKKTQVMKYIVYKRRTEQEVRNKFSKTIDESMLEDIIEYLKEAKYLDDSKYIKKMIDNFKILKNLSIKEVKYKILSKGLDKDKIEDYIYDHKEELNEYEIKSAKNLIIKKQKDMEEDQIKQYLLKKGYSIENINSAISDC